MLTPATLTLPGRVIDDITDFIFISDEPRRADVIFLPGGTSPETPEYAARLYGEGFAPLLIPSGKFSIGRECFRGVSGGYDKKYRGNYTTECEFFTDVLLKNGVPMCAVMGEDKAGFTRENAFFSARLAAERGLRFDKAIIVCKSFHARRCLMYYQFAFPDTELIICPVEWRDATRQNWYRTKRGTERVLGELRRCGDQLTEDVEDYLASLHRGEGENRE
jgi:uncharacterized SAM-binding protein YcdF (DUF218 family)